MMFKTFIALLFTLIAFAYYLAVISDLMFVIAAIILISIIVIRNYNRKNNEEGKDPNELKMQALIQWAVDHKIPKHVFPRSSQQLEHITSLNLSNQKISQLPPEIGMLTQLKELNLDHNLLTELPDEFRSLVNLHTLRLSHNKFKRRPLLLAKLPNITKLRLDNNKLLSNPLRLKRLTICVAKWLIEKLV